MMRKYLTLISAVLAESIDSPVPRPRAHSLLLAAGLVLAAGWVVGAGAQEKAGGAGKATQRPPSVSIEKKVPLEARAWLLNLSENGIPAIAVGTSNIELLTVEHESHSPRSIPHNTALEVTADPHDKVIGLLYTQGYSAEREGWVTADFEIIDARGNRKLALHNLTELVSPRPSPSATYAVGWQSINTPEGRPLIFRAKGAGYTAKPVEEWPAGQSASDISFSANGDYFVIATSQGGALLYDSSGKKKSAHGKYSSAAFTRKWLALSTEAGILIINPETGTTERTLNLPLARKIVPAKDGLTMVLLTMSNELILADVNGHRLWNWTGKSLRSIQSLGPEDVLHLTGVTATPNLNKIVVSGYSTGFVSFKRGDGVGKRSKQLGAYLAVLSADGVLLSEYSPPNEPLIFETNYSTQLRISADGHRIAQPTKHALYIYKVND